MVANHFRRGTAGNFVCLLVSGWTWLALAEFALAATWQLPTAPAVDRSSGGPSPAREHIVSPTRPGFGPARSNLQSRTETATGKWHPIQDPAAGPAQILNFVTPNSSATSSSAASNSPSDSVASPSISPPARLTTHARPSAESAASEWQEPIDAALEKGPTKPAREEDAASSLITGGTEVIRQRYPDGKVQLEREMTLDAEGNYVNHGWWKLFNKNGQVIADGIFTNGLMEGPWKRLHDPAEGGLFAALPFSQFTGPFLSTATFEKGELSGVWQIYDRSDRKVMEVTYRNGVRHGPATWWYASGTKMREMMFLNGILDGKLREWDTNNQLARDEDYVEGRLVRKQVTEYGPNRPKSSLQVYEAKLVPAGSDQWWEAKPAGYETEGVAYRHGPFSAWYENGQPELEGQFENDLREGQFVWWHKNGQKQLVGSYRRNQRTGLWTWWHPNGMKAAEGKYQDDKEVGVWKRWDESGKLVETRDLAGEEAPLPSPKSGPEEIPMTESEAEQKEAAPKPGPVDPNAPQKKEGESSITPTQPPLVEPETNKQAGDFGPELLPSPTAEQTPSATQSDPILFPPTPGLGPTDVSGSSTDEMITDDIASSNAEPLESTNLPDLTHSPAKPSRTSTQNSGWAPALPSPHFDVESDAEPQNSLAGRMLASPAQAVHSPGTPDTLGVINSSNLLDSPAPGQRPLSLSGFSPDPSLSKTTPRPQSPNRTGLSTPVGPQAPSPTRENSPAKSRLPASKGPQPDEAGRDPLSELFRTLDD